MTRKSFMGLAALLGLDMAKLALDSRGARPGLGRGWTQVSANRAVLDEYGRWTPDRIRQANAVNGVGSSKFRKARLREIQKYLKGGKSEAARIIGGY